MNIIAEWLKRNFTLPAVLAMISTIVASSVFVKTQGESIQQLQIGQSQLQSGMKELSDRLGSVERYGTEVFREHALRSERTSDALASRIKDVESFNGSINVILTRLGYIESSLNELKQRSVSFRPTKPTTD